jgi:signal transduction histidine kinase
MEIFNFTDIHDGNQKHRERNFKFAYKLVCAVLIFFIFKFIYKYNYQRFTPLFIILYLTTMFISPIIKKLTKNNYLSVWSFFMSIIIFIAILMAMSGGIRAPGVIWLTLMPFLGASLVGRRGFFWGIIFVTIVFITFILMNYWHLELYPFDSNESYQFEFRINLIIFTITSIYFSESHTRFESEYQEKLKQEKDKNENLLRILFHDLANPLQTIKLISQKLDRQNIADENKKYIVQLSNSTERVIELLNHVKKMKAIEDRKMVYEKKPYMLIDCIQKLNEIFHDRLNEKNLTLNIKNAEDDFTVVLVDQVYFTNQVLANIVSNAIKFSEKGSSIDIEWSTEFDKVKIIISDHGVGMPEDVLNNIFNDNHAHSRVGTFGEIGTGYGMPLVKLFINEFKGEIAIHSTEKNKDPKNSGTKITITLPRI